MYLKKFGILLLILLTGCASKRNDQEIPQHIFNKPATVLIARLDGLEEPYFGKSGRQGLLDYAINSAITSSLNDVLKQIKTDDIVEKHYFIPFEEAFLNNGFKVIKINKIIKKEELPTLSKGDEYPPFNFRALKKEYDADYALILSPIQIGTIRDYYSLIPLGAPEGYANLDIYFVSLEDNKIIGFHKSEVKAGIDGDWDTPPEYTQMIASVKKALTSALKNSHVHFFINEKTCTEKQKVKEGKIEKV